WLLWILGLWKDRGWSARTVPASWFPALVRSVFRACDSEFRLTPHAVIRVFRRMKRVLIDGKGEETFGSQLVQFLARIFSAEVVAEDTARLVSRVEEDHKLQVARIRLFGHEPPPGSNCELFICGLVPRAVRAWPLVRQVLE